MSNLNQRGTSNQDQKKPKSGPDVVAEHVQDQATVAGLPKALAGAAGDGSILSHASHLGDTRFSTAQRQTVAVQVGRIGGNQYLERVAALTKDHGLGKSDNPLNRDGPEHLRNEASANQHKHVLLDPSPPQDALASLVRAAPRSSIMRWNPGEGFVGPPTREQAAQAVLAGATDILGIPNFIYTSVHHGNAVQGFTPAESERYMLFEFWLAVAGREVQVGPTEGTYRRATTNERLTRLAHANETAETVINQLGPAPWPGEAGDVVRAYRNAYVVSRARVMDETVLAELEARPTPVGYEAPEFELEQQRLAVESALAALARYGLLTSRLGASVAARFNTEISDTLNQIAARAPEGSRLAGVANMPIPEAILHTRGVLNGINAILQVSDRTRRNQLLASEFNVRDAADVSRVLLGLAEGLVATTCLIGSAVARLLGHAETASNLFRMGAGQVVRRIGWIAALAQTVHGIAVLLDDSATESERLQAVFDAAMGSAGLTGAAAGLGVEALAGLAGPLSAGILVTTVEIAFLRDAIRGMEEGMATGGIRQSFDIVEYEAGWVARQANELAEAMSYAREPRQGEATTGRPGELSAAANREVQFRSRRLREGLASSIERVTQRQPDLALLFQPASWEEVRRPFVALRAALREANTPDALLRVASAYLEAARDLFRNLARAVARTLRDIDRQRAGGALPHILGGLHEGRGVEAQGPSAGF